jgi:hypothetical protein
VDVVDAGVDDCELDALAGVAGEVDLARPDVLDAPGVLVFEVAGVGGVVGHDELGIELDGLDGGIGAERLEPGSGDLRAEAVDEVELVLDLSADALDGFGRCLARAVVERDDHLHVLGGGCSGRGSRRRRPGCRGGRDGRENERSQDHEEPGTT